MDGPGRPSLYKPEFAEQAFELCLAGATNRDLADAFEVGHSTIDNWLQKQPEFAQAVKRGRVVADGAVARALHSRAIGYSYETRRVVFNQGEPVVLRQTVHKPPDVRAAIFWLRNRCPQYWHDGSRADIQPDRKAGRSAHTIGTVVRAMQETAASAIGRPTASPSKPARKGPVAPATDPPV